jgi:hypothetical protein
MNLEGINALLNYFGVWGVVFLIVAVPFKIFIEHVENLHP